MNATNQTQVPSPPIRPPAWKRSGD